MRLWYLIRKSIYSPEFYRSILDKPFSFSLKYFYSLVLVFALVLTAVLSFNFIPYFSSLLGDVAPAILESFPEGLVITITDGIASTNMEEPILIPVPEKLSQAVRRPDFEFKNLMVIDTRNPFQTEQFDAYGTLVLFTRDSLAFKEREGDLRIQRFSETTDVQIDKNSISFLAARVDALQRWIVPIVVFGTFVMLMGVYSFSLMYLFLGAVFIWLIGKIKKTELSYKKAYQVGIHAVTLSVFVSSITILFPAVRVPFLFTVIMLFVVWFNLMPRQEPIPAVSRANESGKEERGA